MPPINDPRDWDRLFRPNAQRRGGPLRALANVLIMGTVVALLGGGGFFAVRFGLERTRESAALTAEAGATQQAMAIATRTARALSSTATAAAILQAETAIVLPEVVAPLGRGSVINGGNLRSEPVVADNTILGQICPGDELAFLERITTPAGAIWYRIRLTSLATDCTSQRMALGSEGWASSTLLSEPAP
ncbi:MAG: SH3 domain-containing protein [Oscillochloridaceae bacterium umkhey_bin13]